MKIRTQLIVALLLLAVLPLAGIVLYSYVSSRRALRETVAAEAKQLTAEMEDRLAAVKSDLESRMDRLGGIPFAEMAPEAEAGGPRNMMVKRWLTELGDAASLVESFEIVPMAPHPPRPLGGAPAAPAPDAPMPIPPEVELESIILEVKRVYEEEWVGTVDAGDEIVHGIGLGVDVAVAVAEALALRSGAEDDQDDSAEADNEDDAPGPGAVRWLRRLEALERTADRAERTEARRQRMEERHRVLAEERKRTELVLGRELDFPVRERGAPVGWVKPHLSAPRLLQHVLQQARRDQGEVPFAVDAEGNLYVADEADRAILEKLPLRGAEGRATPPEDWVLVTSKDSETGLAFGIARPIRETLKAVDGAARRNLTYGLGVITLALAGVIGLSNRMTRNLKVLTAGAERIADGDLQVRVPVRSRDELGQLAGAFNRMAGELSENQEQLFEQERRRRDEEIERQVLEADNERKTRELEEARQFQLSLLPKKLPEHAAFELAVHMQTATEVGGDYYDFRLADDGALVAAVGDATGHGARAGTMVTVIKSLFSAFSADLPLGEFLRDAARAIQRMDLGRMNMALILAELRGRKLTVASAGMPPALVHRTGDGSVEEIEIAGMPLGSFASSYEDRRLELDAGDTVLLMSDGFPELPDDSGEPLGYTRVRELFSDAAAGAPREIIAALAAEVERWTGGHPPNDDVTFVVLRVR